jgi:hypothetical protein
MWIGKQKQEGVKPVNDVSVYLSTYQEGEGWDIIDRFNPLMFLFTYPHIRKEKDGISLTGLTPSCFSLPIHISGRRRIGYH